MPTPLVILAWVAAIAAVGLAALADAMIRARRLHSQRALRDLAALSWQEFEEVIADAFRRHGYRVREVGGRPYEMLSRRSVWVAFDWQAARSLLNPPRVQ